MNRTGRANPRRYRYVAVSCVLENNRQILLLKRSQAVQTNKGKWSTVSGRVEDGMNPEEAALAEIRAETGLEPPEVQIARRGAPIYVRPTGTHLTKVHPLLFRVTSRNIRLNWEHTASVWISPAAVDSYDAVPKFRDLLIRLGLL